MRRWLIALCLAAGLALAWPASAATGRVIKVLPEFLDGKGRNSVSPSLYDRDAYQVYLRTHPKLRSGMRFFVHWKAKGPVAQPLKIRLELRGVAEGNLPKHLVLETAVKPGGWLGSWTNLALAGAEYKSFGEVTAWSASLWEGKQLLSHQDSFLW